MAWFTLLKRKLGTFAQMSKRERSLLLQAIFLLPLVAVSLHFIGFKVTQQWLMKLPTQTQSDAEMALSQCWDTARMVRIAARYQPWWANCLKQSLVLWALLRQQGIVSSVRIGVQREETFAAHAWVEYDGVVLNDSQDVHQQFMPFQHSFKTEV